MVLTFKCPVIKEMLSNDTHQRYYIQFKSNYLYTQSMVQCHHCDVFTVYVGADTGTCIL